MHNYINIVDYFTLIVILVIMLLAFNQDCGFNLLIVSEVFWICLYVLYISLGIVNCISTPIVMTPILLVFAAVDCSIWILILVYLNRLNIGSNRHSISFDTKFLFRYGRMLRNNRFIK